MTAVLSDGYAWIAGGPATDDNLGPDPHEASLEGSMGLVREF